MLEHYKKTHSKEPNRDVASGGQVQAPVIFSHSCPQCPTKFRLAAELENHRRNIHPDKKAEPKKDQPDKVEPQVFNCTQCHFKFSQMSLLEKHLKVMHSDSEQPSATEKPLHRCSVCNEAFPYKYLLARHNESAHPPKAEPAPDTVPEDKPKHQCSECNEVFPYKYLLTRHIASAHPPGKAIFLPAWCGLKKLLLMFF